jgi:hypothetical protein
MVGLASPGSAVLDANLSQLVISEAGQSIHATQLLPIAEFIGSKGLTHPPLQLIIICTRLDDAAGIDQASHTARGEGATAETKQVDPIASLVMFYQEAVDVPDIATETEAHATAQQF